MGQVETSVNGKFPSCKCTGGVQVRDRGGRREVRPVSPGHTGVRPSSCHPLYSYTPFFPVSPCPVAALATDNSPYKTHLAPRRRRQGLPCKAASAVEAMFPERWLLQVQKALASLHRQLYSLYTGDPLKGKVCDFDVIDACTVVLSMSGDLRRALYGSSTASLELEFFLPELNGNTEILTEDHRKQLCRHLPARAEGYVWTLVFSTSQHGFSLNSMYRKMTKLESPILMVIQDTENNVFGALTSCSLKVSDHFYGTGESLLFRFAPECQVYNWTGDNMYFIKGNNESLAIGAGDGKFGLWLDGDLNQGRTESCSTYSNEPLNPQQDFVVKTLECWAFV